MSPQPDPDEQLVGNPGNQNLWAGRMPFEAIPHPTWGHHYYDPTTRRLRIYDENLADYADFEMGGIGPMLSAEVWARNDAIGATDAGRELKRTLVTSGTSFTTGPDTYTIRVHAWGGGAGGGGAAQAANQSAAGGGGGSGGEAEWTIQVSPNTAYAYVIGAGGAGGAAGANAGAVGGSTTLTVGATTYLAAGGVGGLGGIATATTNITAGGAGSGISTGGANDVLLSGSSGRNGFVALGAGGPGVAQATNGAGGGTGGGTLFSTEHAGAIGVSWGGGGSGAVCLGGAAKAGGAGKQGALHITELS